MYATPTTYDKPAAARALVFAVAAAALMATLVYGMYAAHQHTLIPPVVPTSTDQIPICPIGDDWSCAVR